MANDDYNEAEYETTIKTLRSEVNGEIERLQWRMDNRTKHDQMTKVMMLSKILTTLLQLNKDV